MYAIIVTVSLIWVVSQVIGPASLMSIIDEDECHCFLLIDVCKALRENLNLAGTIIAMIFICIWFSGAILCNLIEIVLFYTIRFIISLFVCLFKRRT